MKLRRNERFPIHQSLFCCGREPLPRRRNLRLGVKRMDDPHHPRGYRELRSPAEMRKLLKKKVVEQNRICAICQRELPTTAILCRTISILEAWEDVGETIIQTTFRPCIRGAIRKKVRADLIKFSASPHTLN